MLDLFSGCIHLTFCFGSHSWLYMYLRYVVMNHGDEDILRGSF